MSNTILLAKLLVPGDFGVVALGASFAPAIEGPGGDRSGRGVDPREVAGPRDDNTAFMFAVIRGVVTAWLLASTHPLAAFFGDPRLANTMLILAAAMPLTSCENIGIVGFQRALTFDKEFWLRAIPLLAGIAAAITVAWHWRSYCALVTGSTAARVLRTLLSYAMRPYRPALTLPGAWLASGRPAGGEAYLMDTVKQTVRTLLVRGGRRRRRKAI